jgi:hypothetical protein
MDTTFDLSQLGKKEVITTKTDVHWERPGHGIYKINVDACFVEAEHTGATGLVVRGSDGALIRAQALWTEHAC